ncbi:MAG: carboxylesterase/lipase family protein [Myxococcota bacterium]
MRPVVETRTGKLEGTLENGVQVFRGIPYAEPPTGDQRFRAPVPASAWAGARDASRFSASAPQVQPPSRVIAGRDLGELSEDCLYLNVWTPAPDSAARPVLFWIHGGGFQTGSSATPFYRGEVLAARGDAVVVTINYRLGALGFLHLAELGGERIAAVSNAGLLDQIEALRWVRDNIASFGGDPENVTIFGESAGGMSVGTLLGTPSAAGLFQRAIAQSGAAHHVFTPASATVVARALLGELGITPPDVAKLLELPAKKVLAAQTACLEKTRTGELRVSVAGLSMPFAPVVDGETIPRAPIESVRAGSARDVSLMVGTTLEEWKFFGIADPGLRELDEAQLLKRYASRLAQYETTRTAAELVEAYRKAREGKRSTEESELFLAMESDRVFRLPAIRLAEAQAAHQPRTYAYLFTWTSPAFEGRLGACHALDIPFVFGTHVIPGIDAFAGSGPEADALSERMMDAWLGFARSGDPGWPAFDEERRATMIFDAQSAVEYAPFDEERRVWDGILR